MQALVPGVYGWWSAQQLVQAEAAPGCPPARPLLLATKPPRHNPTAASQPNRRVTTSPPQNIGKAVYKDKEQIIAALRKSYPPFKETKEFEFAFKIR